MDSSLASVLNANPDLPDLCYGEDATNGIVVASYDPIELRYDALGSDGLPLSTDLFINNTPVSTLNFPPAYVGKIFAVIHMGDLYCFTLTDQDVYI
jgi:hypothetical protein